MFDATNAATNTTTLLKERHRTHGDFRENSYVSQNIKELMRASVSWRRMTALQHEAVDMLAHKLGRISAGDPHCADHWADIAGYAKMVNNMLVHGEPVPTVPVVDTGDADGEG